jgi:hypothetical protein
LSPRPPISACGGPPPAFADYPDGQTRAVAAACDLTAAREGFSEDVRDEAAARLRRRMDLGRANGGIDVITTEGFLDECGFVQAEGEEDAWLGAWLDRREAVEDLAGPVVADWVVRIPEPVTGPPRTPPDDLPARLLGLLRNDSLLGEYASWWARRRGCVRCGGVEIGNDWIDPGLCADCRFTRTEAEADEARRVMRERGGDGSESHRVR